MVPKTVLVTGASSGIGRALALAYASRGTHVAVAARRKDELDQLVRDIEKGGGRAKAYVVDVADPAAAAAVVRAADQDLGALEMVIANAGVGAHGHAATMSWESISRLIDVNVRGAMATLHAAIPIFLAHQGGHLVAVTSLAGRRGLPCYAPYSATKAALSTFLESLRIDLAAAGIKVTDVQPGFVDTPMTKNAKHAMPLRWPVDRAARYIVHKLASAPPVIAFPWPLALLTRLARSMPAWFYDRLTRRIAG